MVPPLMPPFLPSPAAESPFQVPLPLVLPFDDAASEIEPVGDRKGDVALEGGEDHVPLTPAVGGKLGRVPQRRKQSFFVIRCLYAVGLCILCSLR